MPVRDAHLPGGEYADILLHPHRTKLHQWVIRVRDRQHVLPVQGWCLPAIVVFIVVHKYNHTVKRAVWATN